MQPMRDCTRKCSRSAYAHTHTLHTYTLPVAFYLPTCTVSLTCTLCVWYLIWRVFMHACTIYTVAITVLKQQYITLAALEPTLWHRPFHLPSYTAVLSAQKEVLAALILLQVLR
jgi:hypothetical protein